MSGFIALQLVVDTGGWERTSPGTRPITRVGRKRQEQVPPAGLEIFTRSRLCAQGTIESIAVTCPSTPPPPPLCPTLRSAPLWSALGVHSNLPRLLVAPHVPGRLDWVHAPQLCPALARIAHSFVVHANHALFLRPPSAPSFNDPPPPPPRSATNNVATHRSLLGPCLAHRPFPVLCLHAPYRGRQATQPSYASRCESLPPRCRLGRLVCGSPAVGWCPQHGWPFFWPPGRAAAAAAVA